MVAGDAGGKLRRLFIEPNCCIGIASFLSLDGGLKYFLRFLHFNTQIAASIIRLLIDRYVLPAGALVYGKTSIFVSGSLSDNR